MKDEEQDGIIMIIMVMVMVMVVIIIIKALKRRKDLCKDRVLQMVTM